MSEWDLDTSVPDCVIEHPRVLAVFGELGIDDYWSEKSLRYVCGERGLEAPTVLTELRRRTGPDGSRRS